LPSKSTEQLIKICSKSEKPAIDGNTGVIRLCIH